MEEDFYNKIGVEKRYALRVAAHRYVSTSVRRNDVAMKYLLPGSQKILPAWKAKNL